MVNNSFQNSLFKSYLTFLIDVFSVNIWKNFFTSQSLLSSLFSRLQAGHPGDMLILRILTIKEIFSNLKRQTKYKYDISYLNASSYFLFRKGNKMHYGFCQSFFFVPLLNYSELELVKLNLIFQKDIKMQISTSVLSFLTG